jgi:hypothetical protein
MQRREDVRYRPLKDMARREDVRYRPLEDMR